MLFCWISRSVFFVGCLVVRMRLVMVCVVVFWMMLSGCLLNWMILWFGLKDGFDCRFYVEGCCDCLVCCVMICLCVEWMLLCSV